MADLLALKLKPLGIKEGNVVIARNMEEMANLLADGIVDIYIDSPFPILSVQGNSGSQIILRRWKEAGPEYSSTFLTSRDSGITSVEGFVGKIIAFEEPFSTSGFVLPAGTLADRGYQLTEVGGPDAVVKDNEIGYFFPGTRTILWN